MRGIKQKSLKRPSYRAMGIYALIVLTLALLGYGIYRIQRPKPAGQTDGAFYPKAREPSATPSPSNGSQASYSPPPLKPLPVSTVPASSSSGQIIVTSPNSGDTIKDGSPVTGSARVAGDKLYFRLKGSQSGQLSAGFVPTNANSDKLSPFNFTIGLTNQVCDANKNCSAGATDTGVLEVFSISPKDGSEIDQVTIPVKIKG